MEEQFETYDEDGRPTGLAPRTRVHRQGLWHRSVQVFVFDASASLLMQRRAAAKDLYANLWDYSVGEHLQPGESFLQGAKRGLWEELRIDNVNLTALGDERRVEQRGAGFWDREIQQAFRCRYEGGVQADAAEVAEVRYVPLQEIAAWVHRSPGDFTPWFIEDLKLFGWLTA